MILSSNIKNHNNLAFKGNNTKQLALCGGAVVGIVSTPILLASALTGVTPIDIISYGAVMPMQELIPAKVYKNNQSPEVNRAIERIRSREDELRKQGIKEDRKLAEVLDQSAVMDNAWYIGTGNRAEGLSRARKSGNFIRIRGKADETSNDLFDSYTAHEADHIRNFLTRQDKNVNRVFPSIQNEASAFLAGCNVIPETSTAREEVGYCRTIDENGLNGLKEELTTDPWYGHLPQYTDQNPEIDPDVVYARVALASHGGLQEFKADLSDGFTYTHLLPQDSNLPTGRRLDLLPQYQPTCKVKGPTPDCWEVKTPDNSSVHIYRDQTAQQNRTITVDQNGQQSTFRSKYPEGTSRSPSYT